MAEAHQAVAFSFAITHEGWDVNFDREVLHLVWQSGIRSWKKRLARFQVCLSLLLGILIIIFDRLVYLMIVLIQNKFYANAI